jgi:hypothetical protein
MSTDDLFEQLGPPPGGAERFARRLDAAAARAVAAPHRRTFALAGAACTALALIVAVVVFRNETVTVSPPPAADTAVTAEIYDSPAFDRLLGRPMQSTELTVTLGEQAAAVTELSTQNDKVRIYRID